MIEVKLLPACHSCPYFEGAIDKYDTAGEINGKTVYQNRIRCAYYEECCHAAGITEMNTKAKFDSVFDRINNALRSLKERPSDDPSRNYAIMELEDVLKFYGKEEKEKTK